MVSKIEQIIEEIEELIDSCKYAAFSSTKILVDKEEIDELLHELKTHTPDEIMRCQKIISNKEAIMADATEKADAMIREAEAYRDQMVSEHEILQQAYAQAGDIVNQAKMQADDILGSALSQSQEIQASAIQYTDDSLSSIQEILMASIEETRVNNNNLVTSLSQILNVVNANRAELHPEEEELMRNAAIAERAEAERLMNQGEEPLPEYEPEDLPELQRQSASEPVRESAPAPAPKSAPAANPAPAPAPAPLSTPAPKPEEAPAPKAMGGVIRGGIAKSLLDKKE